MNAGKIFETDFKNSVPKDCYYLRIKDPAQSFNQDTGSGLRFSLANPFDCILFNKSTLFTLELKSTKGTSLTFWKEGCKGTFNVKKNQIDGLLESSKYEGIVSGLIINFRKTNHTYFIDINNFIKMIEKLEKKSFNEKDVIVNGAYLISQDKKRTRFSYDIESFIKDLKENKNE